MIMDIEKSKLEYDLRSGYADYCRKGSWRYDWINVLNSDGNILELETCTASFRIVNLLGKEGSLRKYRIIIGNNNKVLWIGDCMDNEYFISCGEKIYKLNYEHENLQLFPNISSENEYFDEDDNEKNDELIIKYRENIGKYRFSPIENAKEIFEEEKIGISISLNKHFEEKFFYKGIKWNKNWRDYYGYNYITILIDIMVINGLFCLEIENITHPFYGYVLLDLNEIKIPEAKKGVYDAAADTERNTVK